MTDQNKRTSFNQEMRQRQDVSPDAAQGRQRVVTSRQSEPAAPGQAPEASVPPRASARDSGGISRGRSPSGWTRRALIGAASLVLAGAVMTGMGLFAGGDSVSPQQVAERQAAYETLLAGPGMPLRMVAPEDVDAAIAAMPDTVSEAEREQVRAEVAAGDVRLAWLTVWDTHVEDGDVLRFESSVSIPIEIMALNAKTTFGVPFPPDGMVRVTGVRDGGGGITVGLESGETRILWPTMQPGDVLDLPVRPAF